LARLADVIPQDAWDDWSYQNAITMVKMTLPGAPIMYYGEEIGQISVNSTADGNKDPAGAINLVMHIDK
jgi:glycosidase